MDSHWRSYWRTVSHGRDPTGPGQECQPSPRQKNHQHQHDDDDLIAAPLCCWEGQENKVTPEKKGGEGFFLSFVVISHNLILISLVVFFFLSSLFLLVTVTAGWTLSLSRPTSLSLFFSLPCPAEEGQ